MRENYVPPRRYRRGRRAQMAARWDAAKHRRGVAKKNARQIRSFALHLMGVWMTVIGMRLTVQHDTAARWVAATAADRLRQSRWFGQFEQSIEARQMASE